MIFKQLNTARNILFDWLGAGGAPVPLEQAQQRADVCLRCPHNYKGAWLWDLATQFAISAQTRLRRVMALRLNGEEGLATCGLCGCVLRLKVHVPINHIEARTPPKEFAKLPTFCWQRREHENPATP